METIIVTVIIGILIAVAIPNFRYVREKTMAAEGVQILESIRRAQWTYYYDDGGTQTFADDLADLEVEIPTPENFDAINDTHIDAATAPSGVVANVRRSTGLFRLYISADGDIYCSGGGDTCCKIGYCDGPPS
ncbi:MAG: hypothetical protein KC897_13390 [Candidatus Omnitrophica bacterium]|nr:hypothetical protein [Candidatus Omnitrophota bacterium]MCB9721798.1 hypothetical protein [Candidatus Omnitrophota bacterium]